MIYRPEIDGLRALAILGVLINHAFPTLMPGGFVGVDIFFVISGYLITGILLRESQSGQVNLAKFYLKRVRRLLPALLVVLISCLVYGGFVLLADEYKQLAKHTAGAGAFIINFMLLNEAGYFDVSSQLKPLLHLWSLGIEEQFYLIWPFLLIWCLGNQSSLTKKIATILLASFLLCIYYTFTESAVAFYMPFTRFWELAAGGLLAIRHIQVQKKGQGQEQEQAHAQGQNMSSDYSKKIATTGLLLILASMLFVNEGLAWPGFWVALPVIGALCLIHAGALSPFTRVWLTNSWVVWLGLISYPLYLWHWPILTFARIERGVDLPPLLSIFLVIISVALAWLTFIMLERPLRQKNERFTFLPLTGLMLLVILSALFVFMNNGLPNRNSLNQLKTNQMQLTSMQADPIDLHTSCSKEFGLASTVRYCNMSGANPKVALIGDSHARAMFDGLAPYMLARGESLLNVGGRSFLGVDSYLKGSDFERQNNIGSQLATQMVIDHKDIEQVVMFALGPAYISGRTDHVFELIGKPEVKDPLQIWEQGIRQTLDALLQAGKKVTFVLNNPEIFFDPRQCINRPSGLFSPSKSACTITGIEFAARNDAYRTLMANVLADYPQVKIFDMSKYLCDEQFCYVEKNGALMYRDDNHLSEAGASMMAPYLYRLINKN
jgi:peptidoglycan/LPS O-acetylase OafA/YrhL/lysophospholipase L1-like esterase